MKVKELNIKPIKPSTGAWSGDIPEILEKIGFVIKNATPGGRHNWTDGEYAYNFIVSLGEHLYAVYIHSNIWCNEQEKLQHILESDIKEI